MQDVALPYQLVSLKHGFRFLISKVNPPFINSYKDLIQERIIPFTTVQIICYLNINSKSIETNSYSIIFSVCVNAFSF